MTYEFLSWDSEFFDKRIGRVDVSRLDDETAAAELERAATEPLDCLYMLVAAHGRPAIRVAERIGAHLVDVKLTLKMPLTDDVPFASARSVKIRTAVSSDIPTLMNIASSSHIDSRFYSDPRLPNERCDALYKRWIERRCEEDPEAVLVAELRSGPVGYLSMKGMGGREGLIDLVAVAPEARGAGVGRHLTATSLQRLADAGSKVAHVVTQGGNPPALRLYGNAGFVVDRVDLWYHYWPDEASSSSKVRGER